ncbi:hypothetical protein POSPLADRAFT_1133399 [Postia placenta MAD-698-R-SB12]|uniref:EXS domain-containing protein n=1 Tax=Postia placenta MAD-698-R-SB12 TaxID=670580 RepID=A0A1X6NCD1_9APHY|nr:hypothetical protein POSPLADRAFT_1133399 [Postia placenta MAD-698-R-SB12]OSX66295.1 hypothetical protein POSPLADRAFT_1133399 [Postia placenta MAD-698-R-SB12]
MADIPVELLFSATFPLPYRVLSLVSLGIIGWATNVHGLHAAGHDARAALDLDHYDPRLGRRAISPLPLNDRTGSGWRYHQGPAAVYKPIYWLFLAYAVWTLTNWLVFKHATYGDLYRVDVLKFVPAVAMLVAVMLLIAPFNVFAKTERDRFLHALHRCLFPPHRRVYFADVVFADVFTSFAKVLGDVWLSFCMLMPGGSLLTQPAQVGLARWILPTLMSLPYAVRFRQCLLEYRATNESRRQLYNALKYATSFPVIYLSAAIKPAGTSPSGGLIGERSLFRLWLFAAAVNSLYSFWWDVTHDWGFDLLVRRSAANKPVPPDLHRLTSPPRPLVLPRLHSRSTLLADQSGTKESTDASKDARSDIENKPSTPTNTAYPIWYPFGLRPILLFPLPIYPFIIVADLVLRLTWSAKLSSHLHSYADGDMLIFCFELAEVVRRWMWVFIRVEWELVKENGEVYKRNPRSNNQTVDSGEDEYEMVPSNHSGRASPGG